MIFDRAFQLEQPLNTPYESPNGFDHTNEMRHCSHCECETMHAVCVNVQDYTNSAGTKRLITRTETRDCLVCTNTYGENLDRQWIDLGKSA